MSSIELCVTCTKPLSLSSMASGKTRCRRCAQEEGIARRRRIAAGIASEADKAIYEYRKERARAVKTYISKCTVCGVESNVRSRLNKPRRCRECGLKARWGHDVRLGRGDMANLSLRMNAATLTAARARASADGIGIGAYIERIVAAALLSQ